MSYDFAGVPVVLPSVAISGLPGATAGARFVGGTVSGPPVSGTFFVGDYTVDQVGGFWTCITAGSPGIWLPGGSGVELASAELSSDSATFGAAASDITGLSITFTAVGRAVVIDLTVPIVVFSVVGNSASLLITDASNVLISQCYMQNANSADVNSATCRARLPRTGPGAYALVAGTSYTFKVRGFIGQAGGASVGTGFLYTNTGAVRPILRAVTC